MYLVMNATTLSGGYMCKVLAAQLRNATNDVQDVYVGEANRFKRFPGMLHFGAPRPEQSGMLRVTHEVKTIRVMRHRKAI